MVLAPRLTGTPGPGGRLRGPCRGVVRATAVCVCALMLAATAVGCSSPPPLPISPNSAWMTRTIGDSGVSLSVPSGWNVGAADLQPSSFSDLIGSFSNQSLSPPCTTGPSTIECGLPLTLLESGAMLVVVSHDSSPLWAIDSQPGTPTTASGWQARVIDEPAAQGLCSGLGADRTRTEVIAFPGAPDNFFKFDICSRGVADAVGARIMESVQLSPLV